VNNHCQEISESFMQPEDILPFQQQPTIVPFPKPAEPSPPFQLCSLPPIWIPSSRLCLRLTCGTFPSGFRTDAWYEFLTASTRATCPANLIFLDFTALITFADEYSNDAHYASCSALTCNSICGFNERRYTSISPRNLRTYFLIIS
jgi:hypothetical protein